MWTEGFCAKCPPDSFGVFATEIISTGYSVYIYASVIFDYVICILNLYFEDEEQRGEQGLYFTLEAPACPILWVRFQICFIHSPPLYKLYIEP